MGEPHCTVHRAIIDIFVEFKMKAWLAVLTLAALSGGLKADATAPTINSMRDRRRVVLIVAPDPQDIRLVTQRRILSHWKKQAVDRDISVVEVLGKRVTGVRDNAAFLSQRYGFKLDRFGILLIGKDGHVAIRSSWPVPSTRLQETIDAMPMRMAGGR